ncbi:MAG: MraY family glycosyltransferase [Candidatus Sumerlaeia bacterium]|nr:MraY family glycosyltransferase [Candidatus Sumerlaeia bacterium]
MTASLILLHLALGFAAWVISNRLTELSIRWAAKADAVATPDHRTSHTGRIPRLGGIGPVFAILLVFGAVWAFFPKIQGMLQLFTIDVLPWQHGAFLVSLGLGGFLLGLLDDLGRLGTLGKLAGQLALASLPFIFGVGLKTLEFPFAGSYVLHPVFGGVLAGLWIVALMNAYNFMDGINGLAGRALECFGYGLLLMSLNLAFRLEFSLLAAAMIGAAYGFLIHNLTTPARTFMGDCGSQGLGAIMAGAALLVHANENGLPSPDPFLPFVLLTFPLLFDVGLTLIRRLLRGENVLKPHREHLYQRYLKTQREDHQMTLLFVSNFFYASVIIAALSFRLSPGAEGFRFFLIGISLGMMMYQWYWVLRREEQYQKN